MEETDEEILVCPGISPVCYLVLAHHRTLGWRIVARSLCCEAPIHWTNVAGEVSICSKCRETLPVQPTIRYSSFYSLYEGIKLPEVKLWISNWLDVLPSEVEVTIEL